MSKDIGLPHSPIGLDAHGLTGLKQVYWSLPTAMLYEEAIQRGEGMLSQLRILGRQYR